VSDDVILCPDEIWNLPLHYHITASNIHSAELRFDTDVLAVACASVARVQDPVEQARGDLSQ
jgi:hypothetical protein